MLTFLLIALVVVASMVFVFSLAMLVFPIRWYVALFLAGYDFIFTKVPEGKFKEVVRFGGHRKTLVAKRGHKINDDGDIVELLPGESPETSFPGGLGLIGWPFIDEVYAREMKFLKSLPDGSVKEYDVKNVDAFYARVDYPYALPFVKCEDKNNLPLLGHATLLAHVVNPVKSLFATANFYETMIGLVLPSVRECLKGFSFDEIKGKDDLDEIVWKELNAPNPEEPEGVIGKLRDKYGIVIIALRIVNIDPPEEYRKITLAKWIAEREADAAGAIARKEAKLTGGTLTLMVDEQIASLTGFNLTKKEKMQVRQECLNMLLRERAGKVGGLKDIRVANADGTSFAGGSMSEIIGGIVAAVAAAASAKDKPVDGTSSGGKASNIGKKGGRKKKPRDMDDDEAEDAADED